MKLAYYNKTVLRNITQMEKKFSSEMCTKVYIQKDYEDFEYPTYITEDPKVEWRGIALNNGFYVPMAPEIECCPADTSIYNSMEKFYSRNSDMKMVYRNMMNAVHFRMSLNGKEPYGNWEKQIVPPSKNKVAHFISHDLNLQSVRGAYEEIDKCATLYGRRNFRLGLKFPLQLTTPDEVLKWGSMTKTPNLSNINLHTLMPDEVWPELTYYRQQFTYYIDNEHWTRETFIEALPKILIQAIFLQSHSIQILLKIDKQFLIEQEWHDYVMLYNDYIKSCVLYRNRFIYCMFTFCKYCYFRIFDEQKISLFYFIKEHNPELFDLLYDLEYATFENGKLIPHMYTLNAIIKGGGYGGYFYKRSDPRKNRIEHFNYAEIVQPESVYLE